MRCARVLVPMAVLAAGVLLAAGQRAAAPIETTKLIVTDAAGVRCAEIIGENGRGVVRLYEDGALRTSLPADPASLLALADARGPRDWTDLLRWGRLRPGMGEAEVVALLGRPHKVRSKSTSGYEWTWSKRAVEPDAEFNGYIEFDGAMRVTKHYTAR